MRLWDTGTDGTPKKRTMKTYKFVIHKEIPSLNIYRNWHWAKRKRVSDLYQLDILHDKLEYGIKHFPLKKCSIVVKSYRHSLIRDADNRILKGLLDALVNQDIIEDDNENVIGVPKYLQFVDRGNRRTEIYITREDEI